MLLEFSQNFKSYQHLAIPFIQKKWDKNTPNQDAKHVQQRFMGKNFKNPNSVCWISEPVKAKSQHRRLEFKLGKDLWSSNYNKIYTPYFFLLRRLVLMQNNMPVNQNMRNLFEFQVLQCEKLKPLNLKDTNNLLKFLIF